MMKKYFAQLRPLERRLTVGVAVVLILVLNWVFIWPHFSDWGKWRSRQADAKGKLALYQTALAQRANYEAQVKGLESQGESVAPQEQAVNFLRAIQTQSDQSHVGIVRMYSLPTRTNDAFFVEQVQNMTVSANDAQLVDFLYKLGNDASMTSSTPSEDLVDIPVTSSTTVL